MAYVRKGKAWLNDWFRAKAVENGGVIRRNIDDVHKMASLELLKAEVKARGFHLIRSGGQYIVLCNGGEVKVMM